MCGIFGYVGHDRNAADLVLRGLKKLEYRGYDSWGVAVGHRDRSEEHTSELQSRFDLVCRLVLEKKKSVGVWYALVASANSDKYRGGLRCACASDTTETEVASPRLLVHAVGERREAVARLALESC